VDDIAGDVEGYREELDKIVEAAKILGIETAITTTTIELEE
jgi:hypothetical protein